VTVIDDGIMEVTERNPNEPAKRLLMTVQRIRTQERWRQTREERLSGGYEYACMMQRAVPQLTTIYL